MGALHLKARLRLLHPRTGRRKKAHALHGGKKETALPGAGAQKEEGRKKKARKGEARA